MSACSATMAISSETRRRQDFQRVLTLGRAGIQVREAAWMCS